MRDRHKYLGYHPFQAFYNIQYLSQCFVLDNIYQENLSLSPQYNMKETRNEWNKKIGRCSDVYVSIYISNFLKVLMLTGWEPNTNKNVLLVISLEMCLWYLVHNSCQLTNSFLLNKKGTKICDAFLSVSQR